MRIIGYKIITALIVTLALPNMQAQDYGLFFAGYDSLKDNRTGIELFPGKSKTFRDSFELSFDLSLHETEKFNFGYVLRAILNENHNVDLLYRYQMGSETFNLVNNRTKTVITHRIDREILQDQWVTFRIQFQLLEDRIVFKCNDKTFVHDSAGFKNTAQLKLYFGAIFEGRQVTTEVAPIMVRDIRIRQGTKTIYNWPLDEHRGKVATEIVRNRHAKVYNPIWLRMRHMQWNHVDHISIGGYGKIIPDQKNNRIYLLGQDQLVTYDLYSGALDTVSLSEDPFLFISHYQGVYDGKNIVSYNPDSKQMIKIDPETGTVFNLVDSLSPRKYFLHHNKYVDTTNNLLYVANGYGHYNYTNELIIGDLANYTWMNVPESGNIYAPRYLAASGFLHDTIYILGGYGSMTGDQRLNPQYFYDLNAIAIKRYNYNKKWEYASPENDFCFANSMVIENTSRNFYALSFPKHKFETQLQLIKGSLDRPTLEKIADPIPYLFNDINSYADLIYFEDLGRLIAVTMYSKDYKASDIDLYSMRYPPIKEPSSIEEDAGPLKTAGYAIIILVAAGTLLGIMIYWRRKLSKKKSRKKDILLDKTNGKVTENAIFFFGGFQVINREGADITKKFTKLLKELFLYITFKSISNSKGTSTERLIEILWFDKDAKSGRNNLSANVAKLKDILKELDGCTLNHETGYWKLIFDPGKIFMEYLEIKRVLEKKEEALTDVSLKTLLEAANRGQFLLNLDYEWLDRYKGEISDKMVDILLSHAKTLDPGKHSSLIIQITNSVFNFDSVNEVAMALKCRTQSQLGKHSLAMKTYEDFCKEYKVLYGEDFGEPFRSIINES